MSSLTPQKQTCSIRQEWCMAVTFRFALAYPIVFFIYGIHKVYVRDNSRMRCPRAINGQQRGQNPPSAESIDSWSWKSWRALSHSYHGHLPKWKTQLRSLIYILYVFNVFCIKNYSYLEKSLLCSLFNTKKGRNLDMTLFIIFRRYFYELIFTNKKC